MVIRSFITCLAVFLCLNLSHSQDTGYLEDVELDSITVYTSRMNIPQTELGRNVSIIDAEQISKLPVSSIDELLRYIPGVEAQTRNGFGVQADFIIRGSTFNQVLVVVDGIRMNDPLTGHFNAYIPVTPAEIERIEVLRGPASSIFGADAVGGVINIITKTFSQEKTDNMGQVEILAGENQLRSVNAGGYFARNRWAFSGGIQSNVSDGQRLPEGTYNYFRVHTISASAGHRFENGWKLAGRLGFAYRDFAAQYFYTRSPLDRSVEEVKNSWAQVQLAKERGNKRSEFNISYKQTGDVFEFNPDFPSINSHTTRLMLFQYNRLVQLNNISIGWGIQADNRSIESNDRGDHNDWHAGVYGIANYSGIENLRMNLSVRGDYDENYDFEVSPQLNLAYGLGKWVLRGSVGRGIRAADYTERFISNNLPGPLTPGRNLGNPDLKAERSWTYEAGFDYFPVNNLRVVATVFRRSSDNLIDYVVTNSNNISNNENLEMDAEYFYATNISKASTSGIETELWINKSWRENHSVVTTIGYTYLDTSSPSGEVSKYIASHASSLFTAGLTLQLGNFQLGVNGLYKARDEEKTEAINADLKPDYFVLNGRASYQVIRNVNIIVQALNILNEDYSDILGARMPQRWLAGGINWRF